LYDESALELVLLVASHTAACRSHHTNRIGCKQAAVFRITNALPLPFHAMPYAFSLVMVLRMSLQEQLLLALYEESALELVLLVASHADERPFRADAPLLLDLLAEVYKVCKVAVII
jgi:hypothetical protein